METGDLKIISPAVGMTARILFTLIFFLSGITHFTSMQSYIDLMPAVIPFRTRGLGFERVQAPLGDQLFHIAERERVAKIPAHGTKNQLRRRLPPLEDCRSGCVLHDLFRLPATPAKVATHPSVLLSAARDAGV